MSKTYNISREKAAKLLSVSKRTVDRYVKSGKYDSRKIDGRVYLAKEDFELSKDEKVNSDGGNTFVHPVDTLSGQGVDSENRGVDSVSTSVVDTVSTLKNPKKSIKNSYYRKLYDEARLEIKEKQERLELANYRVGQLESELRNSVPLLEYHKENIYRQEKEKDLIQKIKSTQNTLKKVSLKNRELQLGKKVIFAILIIILSLQPLWIIIFK